MAAGVIEQIKQKLDIVAIIGEQVQLRRAGKAYKGNCPFHNERTPSFYVFPETGTWRCFGCNEGGDLFGFVAKQQGLEFRDVLALLAERAGIPLSLGEDEFQQPSPQTQARVQLRALNDAAAIWFHHQLLTAANATYVRGYLQTRGISNESIERFRLGFAPEGDELTRYLLGQGFSADSLVDAGLTRRREQDSSLYDYFRNRLIFTIRDGREQTIGFGARELGGGHPKYLNTPQTVLFDKSNTLYAFDQAREAIRRLDQVVIVEGYVDAIIAHQYGYHNTVACIGSAITTKHVLQIKKLTRRLVLALDPDAAGQAATLRAIEIAQEGFDRVLVPVPVPAANVPTQRSEKSRARREPSPQGMVHFEEQVDADIRIMQLPDGIDPDEFIRHDPPAWETALQQALPLLDFYFHALLDGLDLHTDPGKAEAGRRLVPILAGITDRIRQDTYVRRLAGLLRIPERDVQMELRRHRRAQPVKAVNHATSTVSEDMIGDNSQPGPTPQSAASPVVLGQRSSLGRNLEEYCIGLLLSKPAAMQEIYAILGPSDFLGTETRELFTVLVSAVSTTAVENTLALLPAILRSEAERLCKLQAAQPVFDRLSLARTANQVAVRLKRLRLSEAITELSYLQREAEERGDPDSVRALREQGVKLHRELGLLASAHLVQS